MAAIREKAVSYSSLFNRSSSNPCPAATSLHVTVRTGITKTNGGGKSMSTASQGEERKEQDQEMRIESSKRRASTVITEEKARWLRRQLRDTEISDDGMYHSAIATQLAFSDRHN